MPLSLFLTLSLSALAPNDTAFISEARVPLFDSPKETARRIDDLSIGTAVKVLSIEGDRAHVIVGPRTFFFDNASAAPRPVAPTSFSNKWPKGFIAADAIELFLPSREELMKNASDEDNPTNANALWMKVWALDPHDPVVKRKVGKDLPAVAALDTPFERADLVFGCRGDLARATVVAGALETLGAQRAPPLPDHACLAHIDVRPPCGKEAATIDEEIDAHLDARLDEAFSALDAVDDEPPLEKIIERRMPSSVTVKIRSPATAAHKQNLARLLPRIGAHGPALRLFAKKGASARPVFVVEQLLSLDGCDVGLATLRGREEEVHRLRVPLIDTPTTLHVLVSRYTGAAVDIVTDDDPAATPDIASYDGVSLGDAFDVDPRDEPGPGHHLFVAPEAQGCVCD